MKSPRFALIFTVAISCISCASHQPSTKILQTLSNPQTSTNDFVNALKALRDTKQTYEPPSFWTKIANDPTGNCDNRSRAVLQLIHRHFRPGMTLGEIGQMFDHPNWIEPRAIGGAAGSSGLPPHFNEMDGLEYVCILPCEHIPLRMIYFRYTQGSMRGADEVYRCLKGESTNSKSAQVKVDEVVSLELIHGDAVYNGWGIPPKNFDFLKKENAPIVVE